MTTAQPVSTWRGVAALLALSGSTFCYVTIELLPVGLLTFIARDLDRSLAAIGLLVTGYAFVVVLASLPLTRLTHHIPRRRLLTITLALLTVATFASAVAPNYWVLMGARLVVALTQALFWSIVGPTAAGLFPPRVRGRAMSVLFSGGSLGPVLGVPVGTWLGERTGWRAAFLVLAVFGLLISVAVAALLPSSPSDEGSAARGTEPDTRRYAVLVVATALGVTGMFVMYTYLTAFLLDVTGFGPAALGPLLVIIGIADLIGVLGVGVVLDRYPRPALTVPLGLLTIGLFGLYGVGHDKTGAVVFAALTGLCLAALAVSIQNRALQVAPGTTDIASAGTSSAFNLGIAGGSLIGGVLVSDFGPHSTALAGGLLAAGAFLVMLGEPLIAKKSGSRHRVTVG